MSIGRLPTPLALSEPEQVRLTEWMRCLGTSLAEAARLSPRSNRTVPVLSMCHSRVFIHNRNQNPKSSSWTKNAGQILESARLFCKRELRLNPLGDIS